MSKDKALGILPDDDDLRVDPDEKDQTPPAQTDEEPFKTVAESVLPTEEEDPGKPTEEPGEEKPAEKQRDDEPPEDAKAVFERLGLNKRFDTVEEALEYIPESNRYTTRLEQDRAELFQQVGSIIEQRRAQEKPVEEALDGAAFLEAVEDNPREALRKAGFVTREEAERIADQKAAATSDMTETKTFMATAPRIKELGPRMAELFAEDPDYKLLPVNKMIKLLYRTALAEAGPTTTPTKVEKSNPDKRDRATTAGGGKTGGKKPTAEEFLHFVRTAPIDEVESLIGHGD